IQVTVLSTYKSSSAKILLSIAYLNVFIFNSFQYIYIYIYIYILTHNHLCKIKNKSLYIKKNYTI
ncbi:hypothetical protein K7X86_00770, partial [Candidatus Sulcia muelleri]|nr:hypothetical protein [Candidatus Karelsulcia muelleri]